MKDVAKQIKKHEPSRVRAYCGECGGEIHDTAKEKTRGGIIRMVNHIDIVAKKHRDETGHDDLQVDLIDKTDPPEPMDATVNIK